MDNLNGKVALVTGGGRGIGRAIALGLAGAGCDVAVSYRERQTDAESAAAEIRAAGRRSTVIQADVSRGAAMAELARAAESGLGPVDILGFARSTNSRGHTDASARRLRRNGRCWISIRR